MSSEPFHWNWTFICPTGIDVWIPGSNELMSCFQQIFIQIPLLSLFAIISSYYFGRYVQLVLRDRRQLQLIYIRILSTFGLGVLPIIQMFIAFRDKRHIWPVDVLFWCTECLAWTLHSGYLISSKRKGSLNHRGPLILIVIWTSLYLVSSIWLQTNIKLGNLIFPLLKICFYTIYGITLIPSGSAEIFFSTPTPGEQDPLLSNAYIRYRDEMDELMLGNGNDSASFLSKLVFYWVNPLIHNGISGSLKRIDDLFDLPDSLSILKISTKLMLAIEEKLSLFRALHRTFGYEFYSIGVLRFISDMSGFMGPVLLGQLLHYHADPTDSKALSPLYLYAFGMFSSTLIAAVCGIHFNWRITVMTLKLRTGLVTLVYRKSLDANGLQKAQSNVLNLMSIDTDRIANSCISFHSLWSIPIQLFTALFLLYTQIGAAFIAGTLFAIVLIPINRWIAIKIGTLTKQLMTAKDDRVSITSEALGGAKQIKLLAWEDVFLEKIFKLRRKEVTFLSKRKYLDALCVYFWATTPVLMCMLTFGVSVLMGRPLTAATTFTTLALLNMLIGPLNTFPWVLNGLIEAWVSLKRVQQLLNLSDIDYNSYYTKPENERDQIIFSIENGIFEFDNQMIDESNDETTNFKLNSINLVVKKGELICFTGPVGGGKSTILSAILANLNRTNGTVTIQNEQLANGFGYVAQTAWLQRGTLRENIIWGSVFDESRYESILQGCALIEDIQLLGGDLIGVGEGGYTLSGGQKARVTLARAVYQNKEVYLLDDILASLDAHVANHIIKNCILGLLKDKTVLVVSENPNILNEADRIYQIENGCLTEILIDTLPSVIGTVDDKPPEMDRFKLSTDDDNKSIDSILQEEAREYGLLSFGVLNRYWKAMGNYIGIFVILSVISLQLSRNLSDIWLSHWVMATTNSSQPNSSLVSDGDNRTTNYYLFVYIGIAISNTVISLIRSFLFAYAGLKAAKFIHDNMLRRVFNTRFDFFDVTPLGRLLNRFSSDTFAIDDSLPFILNVLLAQLAGLIGAISVTLYAMPWLSLLIIPLCPIYLSIQYQYRCSSRDIKRLSSNALSPLYAHFTETLQGLTTIRAMRAGSRFHRDFLTKLEESIRAQFSASAAQQWLGLRLQFVGALIVGGTGLIASVTSSSTVTSTSMIGLAISYALSMSGLLGGVLYALTEVEQELVAVERVGKYCTLDPEPNGDGSRDPPFGWPCQGVVALENVYLKYRHNLDNVLNGIDFKSSTCERIGIVGRTGAGKSSILAAMLRVTPLSFGRITIDCIDIATLPLSKLRSRITIVPQDAFLFTGSIRDNLDPRGLHLDSEIWKAITQCLATPFVQLIGGLDGRIEKGGRNLSSGQRQLLCLSRAILRNSKIICIDEGTANLDRDSDTAIQLVLGNAFRSSTLFVVAHRLNGLEKLDRIIVLDNGKIVESGSPKSLASDKKSKLYSMLREQQNETFNQ